MKRFLISLLCVVMVVCFMPAMAFAGGETEGTTNTIYVNANYGGESSDGTESKPYKSLQDAVNAAQSGYTVKLLNDIVITNADIDNSDRLVKLYGGESGFAPNLVSNTSLTIDLGGHTISFAEDVKDTTCGDYRLFNVWYTNLTIQNGTLDLASDPTAEGICHAVCGFNNATINLNVNVMFEPGRSQICYAACQQVSITGGTYTLVLGEGETYNNYPYVGSGWYKLLLNTATGCPFYISGGTFVNFDPLCQCKLAHYTTSGLTEGKAMFKDGGTFTVADASDAAATITRTVQCWTDWLGDGTKERTYAFKSIEDALADRNEGETIFLLKDTDEMENVLTARNYTCFAKALDTSIDLPHGYEWTDDQDQDISRISIPSGVSGSIESAVITHDNGTLKNAVSVDLKDINFKKSVQVNLFSGETLLTTATLQGLDAGSHNFLTCCIATETADEYWALTPWTPKDNIVPNKAVLVVDGIKLDEKTFTLDADEWTNLPGTEAPQNSSGWYYTDPLRPARTEAANAVANYVNPDDYEEAQQAEIKTIVDNAKKDIEVAKTADEIKAIEAAAKAELDKIETAEEMALIKAIGETNLVARSKAVTLKNGKKAIKITWYDKNGKEVKFEGVEIFRSTKRYSGFGKEPIYVSKSGVYYNTAITPGTKYYYKVRGYVVFDGEKYYTDWSIKAIRTA